jgi:hypothetical protein
MTRTLFFFTCLTVILVAATAVLLRVDLAYAGVSPLFSASEGKPDGHFFNNVARAHRMFCYLAVMLLGTTMISAARTKGAPLAGLFVAIGVILSLATAVLLILAQVPMTQPVEFGVGWTLYPPLSIAGPQTALNHLLSFLDVDPVFNRDITRIFILPATGLLYLGAYTMLSTEPGFHLLSVFGAILILLVITLSAPFILGTYLPFATIGFVTVALSLIACGAIRLVDGGPAWLLVMTLGMLVTTIAQIAALFITENLYLEGTNTATALLYIFPLGLAWFALPAVLMFASNRLPTWAPWVATGATIAGLSLWLAPMTRLGFAGQPAQYVDYADAFGADNLFLSTGAILFIVIYLFVIVLVRRAAR